MWTLWFVLPFFCQWTPPKGMRHAAVKSHNRQHRIKTPCLHWKYLKISSVFLYITQAAFGKHLFRTFARSCWGFPLSGSLFRSSLLLRLRLGLRLGLARWVWSPGGSLQILRSQPGRRGWWRPLGKTRDRVGGEDHVYSFTLTKYHQDT